jgi:hypothetical protein
LAVQEQWHVVGKRSLLLGRTPDAKLVIVGNFDNPVGFVCCRAGTTPEKEREEKRGEPARPSQRKASNRSYF